MTLAIVLVIIAVLALVLILRLALAGNFQINRPIAQELRLIDIEAFRNLIDPIQADYLRRRLPPSDYRHVQRERLRAAAAYIRVARQNAVVLTRIGQVTVPSSDTQTAEASRQLIDNALLLQRNATFALIRIYFALPWPTAELPVSVVLLHRYEQLNGSAMLLGRLQNPAHPLDLATRS